MKWIGGAVLTLFLLAACSNVMRSATNPSPEASSSFSLDSGSSPAPAITDCENAVAHSNQAFKDFEAGDYSGGFKNANTAVRLADFCPDADMPSVKGFALSARAFSEHHLSVGDSVTDINQATQLLSDCQTQPGYYGTHQGALCETQEESDISSKTNWDMANY